MTDEVTITLTDPGDLRLCSAGRRAYRDGGLDSYDRGLDAVKPCRGFACYLVSANSDGNKKDPTDPDLPSLDDLPLCMAHLVKILTRIASTLATAWEPEDDYVAPV